LKYKKVKFTGKSINTFNMIDREKKNNQKVRKSNNGIRKLADRCVIIGKENEI